MTCWYMFGRLGVLEKGRIDWRLIPRVSGWIELDVMTDQITCITSVWIQLYMIPTNTDYNC